MIPLLVVIFGINVLAGVETFDSAQLIQHEKGAEVRFLATPDLHKTKNAFLGHLTIPAHGKVPLHRDSTEEYLFILKGAGKIWIDGKMHNIKVKDTIFMPSGVEVRFENGSEPLEALQVFARPGPEKKYKAGGWKAAPSVKNKKKAAKN